MVLTDLYLSTGPALSSTWGHVRDVDHTSGALRSGVLDMVCARPAAHHPGLLGDPPLLDGEPAWDPPLDRAILNLGGDPGGEATREMPCAAKSFRRSGEVA